MPEKIQIALKKIPENIKETAEEIRLRCNMPLCVYTSNGVYCVGVSGEVSRKPDENSIVLSAGEIFKIYEKAVNYSAYMHLNELKHGYITVQGGNRVGICGEYVPSGYSSVNALNFRIASYRKNIALQIANNYTCGGILFAGPVQSGKTTFLRDTVRLLSEKGYKITVVDTRYEISAAHHSVPMFDLGYNTDVILGKEKYEGMQTALRTLSPDIIAFDEISEQNELKAVLSGCNTGVSFILSAHIGDISDFKNSSITRELLTSGAIKTVVLLNKNHGFDIYTETQTEKLCC